MLVYHSCGEELFAQAMPRRDDCLYYHLYYRARSGGCQAVVCPRCKHRVSRQSILLPLEQLRREWDQEWLELTLDRQRQAEAENEDAETDQSP